MNIISINIRQLLWLGIFLFGMAMISPIANATEAPPSFLRILGSGNLQQPSDVAVDSTGNVYVASSSTDNNGYRVVKKFTNTGTLITSWPIVTDVAGLPGNVNLPLSIAVDENVVYVAVGTRTAGAGNPRIEKFTLDGTPLDPLNLPVDISQLHTVSIFGSTSDDDGQQFLSPIGIKIVGDFAYVADDFSGDIQVFNKYTGEFITKHNSGPVSVRLAGIAVDPNPSDGSLASIYISVNNIYATSIGVWKYAFHIIHLAQKATSWIESKVVI
ncbi:MAG: SBBP repeat-containing protein [Candidatus Thiothrix moscowensis]|nr:SBBP repeat-containing protein [Candidatus Thiothrix moscowensis]